MQNSAHFFCSLLLWWSLQNLILSLQVLIRPLFGSSPCPWEPCFSMFSEILLPLQSAMTVTLPATPGGQAEHNPFPGRHICIKGFEDTVSQHIILWWHGANFFFYICLSGLWGLLLIKDATVHCNTYIFSPINTYLRDFIPVEQQTGCLGWCPVIFFSSPRSLFLFFCFQFIIKLIYKPSFKPIKPDRIHFHILDHFKCTRMCAHTHIHTLAHVHMSTQCTIYNPNLKRRWTGA